LLLAICVFAIDRIYVSVHALPAHQPAPFEMILGLIAVVSGMAGVAMLAIGPALFRPYEWPPRD